MFLTALLSGAQMRFWRDPAKRADRLRQRHGLIVKGKRISCPPHYAPPNNDYDPPRHDYEHGFPLIRNLRASAQRSASILVSSRRRLDQRAVRCKSRRNRRGAGFQSQGVGDQKRVLRDPNVGLDCC